MQHTKVSIIFLYLRLSGICQMIFLFVNFITHSVFGVNE